MSRRCQSRPGGSCRRATSPTPATLRGGACVVDGAILLEDHPVGLESLLGGQQAAADVLADELGIALAGRAVPAPAAGHDADLIALLECRVRQARAPKPPAAGDDLEIIGRPRLPTGHAPGTRDGPADAGIGERVVSEDAIDALQAEAPAEPTGADAALGVEAVAFHPERELVLYELHRIVVRVAVGGGDEPTLAVLVGDGLEDRLAGRQGRRVRAVDGPGHLGDAPG